MLMLMFMMWYRSTGWSTQKGKKKIDWTKDAK